MVSTTPPNRARGAELGGDGGGGNAKRSGEDCPCLPTCRKETLARKEGEQEEEGAQSWDKMAVCNEAAEVLGRWKMLVSKQYCPHLVGVIVQ